MARTSKGDLEVCPGAEDVAAAYGRRFKPLLDLHGLSRRRRRGAAGADRGHDQGRPAARRRAWASVTRSPSRGSAGPPGWRPATPATPPRSRWPCPPTTPTTCARSPTGSCSGTYSFTRYKSRSDESGVADVSILSDAARRQDAIAALEAARTVGGPGQPCPRLGEHSAERPHARAVRRRGRASSARSSPAASRKPKVDIEVLGAERARGARLRRHPRRRSGLRQRAQRLVKLTWAPEDARAKRRLRRQGHHLRLRRPEHQAGQLDGDDEVRHGRRRRRARRDLRHRRAGSPGGGDHLRPDGREHALRLRDAPRRRADDVRRPDRRGHQHRRRGTADPRPTRWRWRPRTSTTRSSTSPR